MDILNVSIAVIEKLRKACIFYECRCVSLFEVECVDGKGTAAIAGNSNFIDLGGFVRSLSLIVGTQLINNKLD